MQRLRKPCSTGLFKNIAGLALVSILFSPIALAADDADLSQKLRMQIESWLEQAEQNNPQALFNLGQLYRKGVGVEADLTQSELFYRKAAELGHRSAQLNLGTLLYFSDAGHTRADDARTWWQAAAGQGDPEAAFQVAMLYYNGAPDIAKDTDAALAWLKKAESNGHPKATEALAFIEQQTSAQHETRLSGYAVQLGSFFERAPADAMRSQVQSEPLLKTSGVSVISATLDDGRDVFRVQSGIFEGRSEAKQLCSALKNKGHSCFVVHY